MVKAIIIDITGVIFPVQPWVGERPSREELLSRKKIVSDFYDKSKMSKEYLREKIFQSNRPHQELEALYNSLTTIDENVLGLIKKLSEKYPLYSIANEAEKWTDIRKDLYGFQKYFKKLYISAELGMRKPDEGIYKLLLNETGLKPEECLFIDDKSINVEAAQKLGFVGFLYKDFESLKRYLINNGIFASF
jgi:HAD superfamily hydrolase (TIGR01509 family)